jgi:putative acetyltransferase
LNFRSATNKDCVFVQNLIFEILNEYGLKPDSCSTDSDIKDIEANYNNRKGIFEILENDNGDGITTLGIFNIDDKTCELRKMYLVKSERGKGYGKLLLNHAIQKAKELGYKRVILETASVLKEAIQLYRNYGFKKYSPEHLSNRCDQGFYIDL